MHQNKKTYMKCARESQKGLFHLILLIDDLKATQKLNVEVVDIHKLGINWEGISMFDTLVSDYYFFEVTHMIW